MYVMFICLAQLSMTDKFVQKIKIKIKIKQIWLKKDRGKQSML